MPVTHRELVERAERWLRNNQNCGVVFTELATYADEIPDAIGWKVYRGMSILIECKATRSDFLADNKKPVNRRSRHGRAGNLRLYLTPAHLVQPEEVNNEWGLLWAYRGRIKVVKTPGLDDSLEVCKAEQPLLLSALRRQHLASKGE